MNRLLAIANGYGNVDVTGGVPAGYVHVRGARLQPLCRRLGIRHAAALVGWKKRSRRYPARPVLDGVVVVARSAERLRQAVDERAARTARTRPRTPEQREAERQRRQRRDVERFAAAVRERFPGCPADEAAAIAAHACEVGSGRVGRSRVAEDPVRAAAVAHVRHLHTDYESLLDEGYDRDDARRLVAADIAAWLVRWEAAESELQTRPKP